ncbi:MAG: 30S ribosomal protein S8 [Parcubacteria group bacterium]
MSPIANMLTILKNAQAVGIESVAVPFSRVKFDIANVLQEKGLIKSVEKKKRKGKKVEHDFLHIVLMYNDGVGVINGIKLMSKPSRRLYVKKGELHKVRQGYGIAIVSTSKGIMEGNNAKKAGVGGEIIFEIW